jgi:hypothetical protein
VGLSIGALLIGMSNYVHSKPICEPLCALTEAKRRGELIGLRGPAARLAFLHTFCRQKVCAARIGPSNMLSMATRPACGTTTCKFTLDRY